MQRDFSILVETVMHLTLSLELLHQREIQQHLVIQQILDEEKILHLIPLVQYLQEDIHQPLQLRPH